MRRCETRVGDRVRFSLASVFLPDSQDETALVESEVEGVIVDFSDSGPVAQVFAVIELERRCTVVVPVEKLRLVPHEQQSGKDPA